MTNPPKRTEPLGFKPMPGKPLPACLSATLRQPFPAEEMLTCFESEKVNRASYDAPGLIEPLKSYESTF